MSNDTLTMALKQIANLWPYPPHCAPVNPEWVGERDGKMRAIILDQALRIARTALDPTYQHPEEAVNG